MKVTNLIWVLALASALVACNSGPPVQGCDAGEIIDLDGSSPTYGQCIPDDTGDAASKGDATEGACTNDADAGCTP